MRDYALVTGAVTFDCSISCYIFMGKAIVIFGHKFSDLLRMLFINSTKKRFYAKLSAFEPQ